MGGCATLAHVVDRGASCQEYSAVARMGGCRSRGGKGPLPKSTLWLAVGWQCGEHPLCCRRNAEGYHHHTLFGGIVWDSVGYPFFTAYSPR